MTETERLAREAGCFTPGASRNYWAVTDPALARFAELVRAAEREARQEAQRRLEALQERINHADKEKAQAVAAERERCASLCEEHAGLRGTGAWVALTAAADRIRGLIP